MERTELARWERMVDPANITAQKSLAKRERERKRERALGAYSPPSVAPSSSFLPSPLLITRIDQGTCR
jgi:hypothetical protein